MACCFLFDGYTGRSNKIRGDTVTDIARKDSNRLVKFR